MITRVAINGFGRIGRCFFRAAFGNQNISIVAVNDLAPAENLAYLLQYDSVYGKFREKVTANNGRLVVGGKETALLNEEDPAKLPWASMKVDIVVESTGLFTDGAKAQAHITAGAKRVVISAPGKGEGVATILLGANEEKFGTCDITSNGSCTTNAVSPIIGILDEAVGIERAILNTTHAYTVSQSIVDGVAPDDFRRGRAAAINMGPSSTGAAKATALAYPQLKGKFDGIAVRVPIVAGSIADVTFVSKRPTSIEEINSALKAAAQTDRWKKVFAASEEPLVSTDILSEPYGSIADLGMTRVVDGTLVKVLAWYDNEMGYAHTLVQHILQVAKRI